MQSIVCGCRRRQYVASRIVTGIAVPVTVVFVLSTAMQARADASGGVGVAVATDQTGAFTLDVGTEQSALEVVSGVRGYRITSMPTQTNLNGAVVRVRRMMTNLNGSVRTYSTGSWLVFDTPDGRLPRIRSSSGALILVHLRGGGRIGQDGRLMIHLRGM